MIAKAKIAAYLFAAQAMAFPALATTSISLNWDPSPDPIQGYFVYTIVQQTSQTNVSDVGNTTTAVITNLVPGQSYRFFVTAHTNGVQSDPSNVVDYTPVTSTNPSRFLQADTTTQGNWKGAYGYEGYWVAGTEARQPAYGRIATTASQWTWTSAPTSPIAPYRPGATTNRIASCWYSATPMEFAFSIEDGQLHRLSMYFMDWSRSGRHQVVELIDLETGDVLDSQTLTNFSTGIYLTWEVTGAIGVRVTPHNVNAVVSAIFFDPLVPPVMARFVKSDSTTRGNWFNVYGAEGSIIAGDATTRNPSYASMTIYESSQWTYWTDGRDQRALLRNSGVGRIAGVWYSRYPTTNAFYVDINMQDEAVHQVAIYALDWYNDGRAMQIDVLEPASGLVLDSRKLQSYWGGEYLVWDIKGSVRLRVSTLAGPNAMLSGIFFGPPSAPL